MPAGPNLPPTALTRSIAAIIRSHMGFMNMSQVALARATGIPQATISRLVRGKRVVDVEQLDLICRALRVSSVQVYTDAMTHVRENTGPDV